MGFKAIIYDLDGLLIDSMIHWKELDAKFLADRGIELTDDMIKHMTGKSTGYNANWLKKNYEMPESIEELIEIRSVWFLKIYNEASKQMPGADELIKIAWKKKIKQAIASGAPMIAISTVVNRFGWDKYFDELVSVEHIKSDGKPDPAIFLFSADKLEVSPEDCVVFEDAESGVLAAKGAGMKCIAVPDERWSFGDFSQADLIVDSMDDKEVYEFLQLDK